MKQKKFLKTDTMDDFKYTTFVTLKKTNEEKKFVKLTKDERLYTKAYINYISLNKNIFSYYRGDNLVRVSNNIINNERPNEIELVNFVDDYFILGQKGKSYSNKDRHLKVLKKKNSETDRYLENLLLKIKNNKPFFKEEDLISEEEDYHGRARQIIAISHNIIESFEEEDENRQFLSVSVGNRNYDVAKSFSEGVSIPIIIMGFESISNGEYIDSMDLIKFRTQEEEILIYEQEIILEFGIWPQQMVGIFIMLNNKKHFIVNPWLINDYHYKNPFENLKINIDQSSFELVAQRNKIYQMNIRSSSNFNGVDYVNINHVEE